MGLAAQDTASPEEELLDELLLDEELELLLLELELLDDVPAGGDPGSPPHALKSTVAVLSRAVPSRHLIALRTAERMGFDI